ncbi:MAG: hypothetical protein ACI8UO_003751 [Verrucomicrobiales bacterium]|jgi:hypothetical protein
MAKKTSRKTATAKPNDQMDLLGFMDSSNGPASSTVPPSSPKPEAEAEPKSKPEAGPKPKPEEGPKPKPEAGPKPKPEAGPKPKPKVKPTSTAGTTDTLLGGAKGKPRGVYLQEEDVTAIRKLRARLLDLDMDANQSQVLRAGLLVLGKLPADEVGELVEQVKAKDGRRRSP